MPLVPLASTRRTEPELAQAWPHPSYARATSLNPPETMGPTPRWWQAPCPQGRGFR